MLKKTFKRRRSMNCVINIRCFPIALTSPFETTTIAKLVDSLFLHFAKWPSGAGRVQCHFAIRPVASTKTACHEEVPEYHYRRIKLQP